MRNIDRVLGVRPERLPDIGEIRALLYRSGYRLGHTDKEVELLWAVFSADESGDLDFDPRKIWLAVDEDHAQRFIQWLQT